MFIKPEQKSSPRHLLFQKYTIRPWHHRSSAPIPSTGTQFLSRNLPRNCCSFPRRRSRGERLNNDSLINAFQFYWEYLHNSPFSGGGKFGKRKRSFARVARRRRRRSTSPRIPGATTRSAVGSNLPLSGLRTAAPFVPYVGLCVSVYMCAKLMR